MIAFVQSAQGAGGNPTQVNLGALPTQGNLLVVAINCNSGVTNSINSVTDNAGNSYVRAKSSIWQAGYSSMELWYAKNVTPATTSHTITISNSVGGTTHRVVVDEYSGIDIVSPLDQTDYDDNPTTNTFSAGPTGVTVQADELVVMAAGQLAAGTMSVGSGYSNFHQATGATTVAMQSKVVAATGTQSGSITTTVAGNGIGIIATFKGKPAPTVTNVSPNTGTLNGGTAVTITGTNFVATPTVTFGGAAASNVTFVNSTTLTCVTPAHAIGAVDVVVTNPDTQTGTAASAFTYFGYDPAKNIGQSLALSASAADVLTAQIAKTDSTPVNTAIQYAFSGDGSAFQNITPVAAFSENSWTPIVAVGQSARWRTTLSGTPSATPVITELNSYFTVGIALDATTKRAAQSVVPLSTTGTQRVDIYMYVVGTPGNVTCRIETDSSNAPSGTLVDANATVAVAPPTAGSWRWVSFNFPASFVLSAATKYWIVLSAGATLNSTNKYLVRANNNRYSSGDGAKSINSGAAYTIFSTNEDLMFAFYSASSGNFAANITIDYTKRYL